MQATKRINERPSKYSNLGQDVMGAHRHNFDTYDNPEKKAEKERAKKQKANSKDLKQQAVNQLTEVNYREVLDWYEFRKTADSIEGYQGDKSGSDEAMKELRSFVESKRGAQEFGDIARKYNRLARTMRRNRWRVKSFEAAQKYFETKKKDSFTEFNGIKRAWTLSGSFDQTSIDYLATKTRAVQFGNSLPESEREYCLENLAQSIKLIETKFIIETKTLAFSFGARGKAGSVAHYQDSERVLAFNRGWDGAFIHELGHAIDYSLGLPSWQIPDSVRTKYRSQLLAANIGWDRRKYYESSKELFARLFEAWIRTQLPETTDWMQSTFNQDVMPELDTEALNWMNETMKPLMRP